MIVNGVTLPDIPAEVLKEYPYAVILYCHVENNFTRYGLLVSNQLIGYCKGSLIGASYEEMLVSFGEGASYECVIGGESWSLDDELQAMHVNIPIGDWVYPTDQPAHYTVVWANHNIYEATSVDLNTGTYTKGDIYFPFSMTYPEIPAEVLEKYPYCYVSYCMDDGVPYIYKLFASSSELTYVSPSLAGYAESGYNFGYIASLGNGYQYYKCNVGDNTWTLYEEVIDKPCLSPEGDIIVYPDADVNVLTSVSEWLVWANHDIYTATGFDTETKIVTEVGTVLYYDYKEPIPTRISIGRSLVDGYAREVQRLTGTTDQMNAVQIREKLSTVKAAIKIGDTVLPAIPEDVLAVYPYAVIGLNSDYNVYFLGVSDTPFAYLPAELTTTGNAFITTVGFRHKFYSYDGSAWVVQNENSTERIYQELDETIGVCWANYDICIITSRTDAQGEITVGTEVYFSERQNFNGVWLPKIPEYVLAEYPYAVILKLSSPEVPQSIEYRLLVSTSIYAYVPEGIMSGDYASAKWIGTITDAKMANVYGHSGASEWGNWNDHSAGNALYILSDYQYAEGVTLQTSIIWTNHDIYELTSLDTTTGSYTIGDIYFPPLPPIDTDRVSIGYDLFDSIVEEVQRLSGETDKMNALRAYWKLTTVV